MVGVELVEREGAATRETARLVIGADGSSSQVREALGVELPLAPYPAGYFIIDFERPHDFDDCMSLHLHRDGGVMVVPQRPGVVGVAVLVHGPEMDLFRAGALDDKVAAIRAPLPGRWRRARRCRATRTSTRCRAGTPAATSRAARR